jgi:hypothetical protein
LSLRQGLPAQVAFRQALFMGRDETLELLGPFSEFYRAAKK